MNVTTVIVLPVESSRLLAGKSFYNNTLQSHSREFFTLKGMTKDYENKRLHRRRENKPNFTPHSMPYRRARTILPVGSPPNGRSFLHKCSPILSLFSKNAFQDFFVESHQLFLFNVLNGGYSSISQEYATYKYKNERYYFEGLIDRPRRCLSEYRYGKMVQFE
jgi:hypothetical protein